MNVTRRFTLPRWATTFRVTFVIAVTLGFLFYGLPGVGLQVAEANQFGRTCRASPGDNSWSGNTCVSVNNHKYWHWNEALLGALCSCDVYIDYLLLVQAGRIVKQTNPDRWYHGPFGAWPQGQQNFASTDWAGDQCSQASGWRATVRLKVRPYQNSGAGTSFVTYSTPLVTTPTC